MKSLLNELRLLADGKAYMIPVGTTFSGTENECEWWYAMTDDTAEDDYKFFRVMNNKNPEYTLELCPDDDFSENVSWYGIKDCDKKTVKLLIKLIKEKQNEAAKALQTQITDEYENFVREAGEHPNVAYVEAVWKDDPSTPISSYIAIDSVDECFDDRILFYCDSLDDLLSFTEFGVEDFKIIAFSGYEIFK